MSPKDIESVLSQQSELANVSVAKLRAVYIRGIKEAVASGAEGPLDDYGLARVQRFTAALSNQNPRVTHDHDLMPRSTTIPETANLQIQYSDEDFKTLSTVSAILTGELSKYIDADQINFDAVAKELLVTVGEQTARINLITEEYSTFSKG